MVYYFVAFTYRAKPNLIVKELYVAESHRRKGVGNLLMKAVAQEAERTGCGMIKWWFAKWNKRGIECYQRLGARIDPDWHEFQMSEEAFRELPEVVVIPSAVEGSRCVTFNLSRRDRSLRSGNYRAPANSRFSEVADFFSGSSSNFV